MHLLCPSHFSLKVVRPFKHPLVSSVSCYVYIKTKTSLVSGYSVESTTSCEEPRLTDSPLGPLFPSQPPLHKVTDTNADHTLTVNSYTHRDKHAAHILPRVSQWNTHTRLSSGTGKWGIVVTTAQTAISAYTNSTGITNSCSEMKLAHVITAEAAVTVEGSRCYTSMMLSFLVHFSPRLNCHYRSSS